MCHCDITKWFLWGRDKLIVNKFSHPILILNSYPPSHWIWSKKIPSPPLPNVYKYDMLFCIGNGSSEGVTYIECVLSAWLSTLMTLMVLYTVCQASHMPLPHMQPTTNLMIRNAILFMGDLGGGESSFII